LSAFGCSLTENTDTSTIAELGQRLRRDQNA
jgi:hypothetical protein